MGKDHRGRPSGTNKEEGLGVRSSEISPEKLKEDERVTEKYTKEDEEKDKLADSVKVRHPNRNTDKDDSTNAGGYRQ
jgi:hypothetical protein